MERIWRLIEMENKELEFRQVKALEDIADYMRRMDDMMQVLLQTLERIETDVSP